MNDRIAKLSGLMTRLTGSYRPKVWLLGDGRSGTTWLSEMLICSGSMKYYFEPIHPGFSPELKDRKLFFDLDKQTPDTEFDTFVHRVFNAKLKSGRALEFDQAKLPVGLLVKDIYGHLLINRVLSLEPSIKPVLLVRHPSAVADSKIRYADWNWKTDPEEFLDRESLGEYFNPWREKILSAETLFQKHVIIWCMIHRHVLYHVDQDALIICHYEELIKSPEAVLDLAKKLSVPLSGKKLRARWSRPSKSVVHGSADQVTESEPDHEKAEFVDVAVREFGLESLIPEV